MCVDVNQTLASTWFATMIKDKTEKRVYETVRIGGRPDFCGR